MTPLIHWSKNQTKQWHAGDAVVLPLQYYLQIFISCTFVCRHIPPDENPPHHWRKCSWKIPHLPLFSCNAPLTEYNWQKYPVIYDQLVSVFASTVPHVKQSNVSWRIDVFGFCSTFSRTAAMLSGEQLRWWKGYIIFCTVPISLNFFQISRGDFDNCFWTLSPYL